MATLRSYSATVGSFSPLLHLRLNEAAGTIAFDSADDFDGEYRGGFTLGADGPIGNGAVGLDGSTGYVFVPHQDQLLLTSGSVEVWFTLATVSGDHNLFAKNSTGFGTGGQIAGAITDGNASGALGDLETNHLVIGNDPDDPQVQAGVPAQMVFTFGDQGMQLYLDGQLVDTNPYTGGLAGNFEFLVVGAESGTNESGTPIDEPGDLMRFFDGAIDEFVIYDRALSQTEVQQLFQAGERGLNLTGTADDDALIGGLDDEVLSGRGGNDDLRGGGGNDLLRGAGGQDDLRSGAGDDHLQGGPGRDELRGGAGRDELFGGRTSDVLSGGAGDDLLNGGPGRDTLTGSTGSDTFEIDRIGHGVDRIRDFEDGPGGDVLDLSAILNFGGADEVADFVRLSATDNNTTVAVNRDGAGTEFTAVFNLLGVAGLDLATLVADGNLRLEPPPSG